MREAAAFGAAIRFPEDAVPYSEPPLLAETPNLSLLKDWTPMDNERTLDRVRAVELLHIKAGRDYPVIGWVEGVLAETADLRGVSTLMLDLADEEPWLEELMEFIFVHQCRFAKAQVDAGADIIGIGNAVASLVGPILYEQYALSYDKQLVSYIQRLGARAKLHICGNIQPLLPLLTQIAPDILDVDWAVDFRQATMAFRNLPTSVCGNIDPVAVLPQGGKDSVQQAVTACIEAGDNTTLIAAGCEVPAATPEENLLVMDALLYT